MGVLLHLSSLLGTPAEGAAPIFQDMLFLEQRARAGDLEKTPSGSEAAGLTSEASGQGIQTSQVWVRGACSSPGDPDLPPLTGKWDHTPRNGDFVGFKKSSLEKKSFLMK